MCLIKLYKKIDKKLKLATIKTLDFYSNIIAGVVGGTIIYFVFVTKFIINWISLGSIILLYFLGLIIISGNTSKLKEKSRKKQISNYHWNLLAAILGAIFLSLTFNFQEIWIKIISGVGLLVSFILISYFRIKR